MAEAEFGKNLSQQLQGGLEWVPPPKGCERRAQGLFLGEKNPILQTQATIQISPQKEEVSFKQIWVGEGLRLHLSSFICTNTAASRPADPPAPSTPEEALPAWPELQGQHIHPELLLWESVM